MKRKNIVIVTPALAGTDRGSEKPHGLDGMTASDTPVHPDHFKSTKTREQVLAELDAARADGSLRYLQRGLPVPDRNPGMGRSREEVAREAASMTFQEKRHMHLQTGRGR